MMIVVFIITHFQSGARCVSRPPYKLRCELFPKSWVVLQSKDADRIREFLLEHKPHAVLVAAANMKSKVLKEDLDRVRDHILEHMPQVRIGQFNHAISLYGE